MIRILALLLLPGVATAQGACPVAEDLSRGIRVTFDDGGTQSFRRAGEPGVVRIAGRAWDGSAYRMEVGQGLYVLTYVYLGADGMPDEASRVSYDYGMAPAELPVPAPGGRFQAVATMTDATGVFAQAISQAAGEVERREIGGCSYDVLPLGIAYDTVNAYTEGLDYLPELGIALLRWQEGSDIPRHDAAPVSIAVGK